MLIDLQPPPVEPITLAEAKAFIRVDHDDEDALITTLIASARDQLEAYLNTAMIARPMQVSVPAACEVRLPRWPVMSVETVLSNGVEISEYHVDLRRRPATLSVFATDHIEIAFTAGYGLGPEDVPAPLRQAMLLLVSCGFEHRDIDADTMPLMVDALTMPYRVVGL